MTQTTRLRSSALLLGATGLFLLLWLFPVIWTVLTSFKTAREIFAYPPTVLFEPFFGNYGEVLGGNRSLLSELLDSTIVTVATTVITLLVSIPLAYALATMRVRWRTAIGLYVLFTYMIPRTGLVIPYFVLLDWLGLRDTYVGLVFVYLSFSIPFAVWILISYFEDVPSEVEEAAWIDRASRIRGLWHVVLPQIRGGIAVATIFVFIHAWNEFLFAVILSGNNVSPVTVAMYNFIGVEQTQWGALTAGAVIAMLPVIVLGLFAQRSIVQGLSAGAVK